MSSSEGSGTVRGEGGFSILEVVISLVILMTVLVSVSSLLVDSFKVGANSRFRQAATEIATSNLDYQVQVGATTLVGEVGDTALPTVTSAGQQYYGEMEIAPYTASNGSACANPNGGLAMLKITVWVTWATVASGSHWWKTSSSSYSGDLVEETTLLALPSTAFNSADGSVLVDVTGAAGSSDGIQGVTVTASYGGTTYTAVTTSAGCALFANLTAGVTWVITGSATGYIDGLDDWSSSTNSASPVSADASVVAGNVNTVDLTYDQEATVSPTYSVTLAGATPWLPSGVNSLPLTFYTSYVSTSPPNGYVAESPGLVFPYTSSPSYSVVAGSCGVESSPYGASDAGAVQDGQPVTLTPGGTASPNFALQPFEIVVSHSGAAVSGATINAAVSASDANCSTGTLAMPTLGLGTSCVPGGTGPTSCSVLAADRRARSRGRHRHDAILLATTTSTSLSSTYNPSVYDSSVTFNATVTRSSGSGTPLGTISFTAGGSAISGCTGVSFSTTTSTTGTASCTTSSLAVTGGITIKATYNPTNSNNFSTSNTSISQVVNGAPTTTTLSSTPNPNSYGTSATLSVSVTANSPSSATPTGTVTYQNGGVNITSPSSCVNLSLAATCTVSGLAGGTASLTAVYNPSNGNFVTSTGADTQTISAASTTTTVTSSSFLDASTSGTSVTFTATVAAASGGPATGTVAFKSNGTVISGCTAQTMTAGVATCTTTTLAVGNDTISAVYSATNSLNFGTSTGTVTQLVYLEGTTPSIETGLPYGSWILTITYTPPFTPPATGTQYTATYTMLINQNGIYINGVKATTSPIQLSD
jgi:large repetitive protein